DSNSEDHGIDEGSLEDSGTKLEWHHSLLIRMIFVDKKAK
ncbi:17441_t:CDS:1, partial [Acaulospora morrowiae]